MAKKNKNQSMMIHFKRRLYERFYIRINDEEIKNLIKQIQNNQSEWCCKISNCRVIHKVTIQNQQVYVVYNKERKSFHTVLPKNFNPDGVTNNIRNTQVIALSGLLYD